MAHESIAVQQALAQARQQGLERLDAQWLLSHVLMVPSAWLMAHDDACLTPEQAQHFQDLVNRRAQGEPLAYLLGDTGFYGLVLKVNPHVLVPRPDTETLVDWALALMADANTATAPVRVLDMGTGSGAVALAIQYHHPQAMVTASDISEAALHTAMDNAVRLQLPVRFIHGDWFAPFANTHEKEQFDVIVSNPPYVADADPHLAQLVHEPQMALTAGHDGLQDLQVLTTQAPQHLKPGGWLLLEHGYAQHATVQAMMQQAGYSHISTRHDLAGQPRCTGGQWLG